MSLPHLGSTQIPSAPRVLGMRLNRQGNLLLVNCHDRIIRMFELRARPHGAATHTVSQVKEALEGIEVRQNREKDIFVLGQCSDDGVPCVYPEVCSIDGDSTSPPPPRPNHNDCM